MPKCQMRHKAGMFAFLLVCLLCLASCGKEKVVFESDAEPVAELTEEPVQTEEITEPETAEEAVKETKAETAGLVNINEADAQMLMTLPGIGETRAAAIIAYREQTGRFQTVEDIMNVKGIKSGVFSKISKLICVK